MLLLPTTLLDTLESTTLARGPLTLMLMPTPSDRLLLVFPMPTLLPPDMLTTPDTLPTPHTPPTLCTTPMLPTMLLLPTTLLDTLESTTLARGLLMLMPMPTPLDRWLPVFPMPMLLPPDMLTTPDTLPTPLSPPPPTLPTMLLLPSTTDMASTVPTTVKHTTIIKIKPYQITIPFSFFNVVFQLK